MKSAIAILALLLVSAVRPAFAAPILVSSFDTGLDGWTATDVVGGTPAHVAAGGNPGGYLFVDNAESAGTFVIAPSTFLGDLTAFDGGTLAFDAHQITGNGQWSFATLDFGHVWLTGTGGAAIRDLAVGPVPVGSWATYSIPLTAVAWGQTTADWAALLANVTEIRVSLEGTFGAETNGFDNFRLTGTETTTPVPEPGTVSLVLAGALTLLWRGRRVRRLDRD